MGTTYSFGSVVDAVHRRLSRWEDQEFANRLWKRDHTLWSAEPVPEIVDRLGWLRLPDTMRPEIVSLSEFGSSVADDGFTDVVVLGMGGSSLAPEVFQDVLGNAPGHPRLHVLDSTHPDAVTAMAEAIDEALFIVASKSGTTLETLSFFRWFWDRAGDGGDGEQGRRFVAITDPGTPLESLAHDRDFRAVFLADPEVGGRYSALTHFGLVPAAAIGGDAGSLLAAGRTMANRCGPDVATTDNPGLILGAALGEAALTGRDKLTFVAGDGLDAFPAWIEQLVAESTGKDDTGIIPVVGEPRRAAGAYGEDRFFVSFGIGAAPDLTDLSAAGHPVVSVTLDAPEDLGGEMFRWEVAVAAAGAVLEIHPFNQPDVQVAKDLAKRAMAGELDTSDAGGMPAGSAAGPLAALLDGVGQGDYVSIHAYLPPGDGAVESGLDRLRALVAGRTGAPVTLDYGPRFLHSTGQLHKGGPDTGVFLQLVDDPVSEVTVPETDYSFRRLVKAQADGDLGALRERGRRVRRVELGADPAAALDRLLADLG